MGYFLNVTRGYVKKKEIKKERKKVRKKERKKEKKKERKKYEICFHFVIK